MGGAKVRVRAPAEGELLEVDLDGGPVVVGRCDGALFALDGVCPHAGGMLGEGTLDGTRLRCPLHDWGFDVRTGACDAVPRLSVAVVPVREVDGGVEVGPLPGPPAVDPAR